MTTPLNRLSIDCAVAWYEEALANESQLDLQFESPKQHLEALIAAAKQISGIMRENERLREALNGLRGTVDKNGFSAWASNEAPAIRAIEVLQSCKHLEAKPIPEYENQLGVFTKIDGTIPNSTKTRGSDEP